MRREPVTTEGAGSAGEKDLLLALQRWGLEREDTGAALGQGRKRGSGTECSSARTLPVFSGEKGQHLQSS